MKKFGYFLLGLMMTAGVAYGGAGLVFQVADKLRLYQGTNGAEQISNCGFKTSVAANALTVTLTDGNGNLPTAGSPCYVQFYTSNTGVTGQTLLAITGTGTSESVTVPSGDAMGCASGIACEIYVYAVNASGQGSIAISPTYWTDGIQTLNNSGFGQALALYSPLLGSNVIRLIGKFTITEATAGTWATNASQLLMVPFHLELGPQLWASLNSSGGTDQSTTSAVVASLPTIGGPTLTVSGNAVIVTNDFRLRANYLKPGKYTGTVSFVGDTSATGTVCEFYFEGSNLSVSALSYTQSGFPGADTYNNLTMSGWAAATNYQGQSDFFVNWRRTSGAGSCFIRPASSGGVFSYTLVWWPYINGI